MIETQTLFSHTEMDGKFSVTGGYRSKSMVTEYT